MKQYIDALTNAQDLSQRRDVTRDLLGIQGTKSGPVISGWIGGALITWAIVELVAGIRSARYQRHAFKIVNSPVSGGTARRSNSHPS